MAKRPAAQKLTYVGPAYQHGIRLPGTSHEIRPADFTPEQVAEFVQQHPKYAHWWQAPEAPPPPEERSED